MKKSVVLSWWNTGVAPPTKSSQGGPRTDISAIEIILEILESQEIDFFGLAEVNLNFLNKLELAIRDKFGDKYLVKTEYKVFEENDRRKYSILDIGYIYNPKNIKTYTSKTVEFIKEDKVEWHGVKLQVKILNEDMMIYLIHFPSQKYEYELEFAHLIGKLRDEMFLDKRNQPVIAFGDFNQDLYSDMMLDIFNCSNDPVDCINLRKFYNPFWKHMGNKFSLFSEKDIVRAGSYYYGNKKSWHFFDYALLSSEFVNIKSKLVLDEDSVCVIDGLKSNETYKNDHHPIKIGLKEMT
jgi:hypothetical protein